MSDPLLTVTGLNVVYGRHRGPRFHAVFDVDLQLEAGRTLGIVGESGAGKSTVGGVVAGLVTPSSGTVAIDGRPIGPFDRLGRRRHARLVQTIFQDPYNSLNPARTVEDTLCEPMTRTLGMTRPSSKRRAAELLGRVGLDPSSLARFPNHFSGGQRQRIAIARALSLEPRLIVCDEPVSALDLSVQAQVLNLLVELQQKQGIALLFISHDLAVVRHIAHDLIVMRQGRVVESGPAPEVLTTPRDDYTRRLLLAAPVPDPREQARRRELRRVARRQTAGHLTIKDMT